MDWKYTSIDSPVLSTESGLRAIANRIKLPDQRHFTSLPVLRIALFKDIMSRVLPTDPAALIGFTAKMGVKTCFHISRLRDKLTTKRPTRKSVGLSFCNGR